MVHDGIDLQFDVVAFILQISVLEIERNKAKLQTAVIKDEIFQTKVYTYIFGIFFLS